MKLYRDLASWFHLLTAPEDYAEEAAAYVALIRRHAQRPVETLLELGAGGGNNASHYKAHFRATLTDVSPEMLEIGKQLNPECEHRLGDMRTLRLGQEFDAVLVHDAVMYMTTEADLRAAMATAFAHLATGGVALFVPDVVRESFLPATSHGGHDSNERSLRYLEWTRDLDPDDTAYEVDFALLLSEEGEPTRFEHDRHVFGLFAEADWLRWLQEAGFDASLHRDTLSDGTTLEVFAAVRPV
jgi:SAM-dependent methyltransferase